MSLSRLFAALALAVVFARASGAQPLTDEQVTAVLNGAVAGEHYGLHLAEFNISSVTGFTAWVYPPAAWVANIVSTAKREYRTLTLADITAEDRADVWRIRVNPSTPTKMTVRGSNVQHAVLRDKRAAFIVQPTAKEPFDVTLGNALGAKATYVGQLLTFPGPDVRTLWGEKQDQPFILSIVGDTWRYDFEIKDKHFERLGAPRRKGR